MLRDLHGRVSGKHSVLSGVRMPRMNSMIERWIQSCRRELLDRTLIWNQAHLLHALREHVAGAENLVRAGHGRFDGY